MFDADKTRTIVLPYGEKNYDDVLSRFHLIPERHGQTDGHNCYINIARQLISSIESPVAHACQVWSTSVSALRS